MNLMPDFGWLLMASLSFNTCQCHNNYHFHYFSYIVGVCCHIYVLCGPIHRHFCSGDPQAVPSWSEDRDTHDCAPSRWGLHPNWIQTAMLLRKQCECHRSCLRSCGASCFEIPWLCGCSLLLAGVSNPLDILPESEPFLPITSEPDWLGVPHPTLYIHHNKCYSSIIQNSSSSANHHDAENRSHSEDIQTYEAL